MSIVVLLEVALEEPETWPLWDLALALRLWHRDRPRLPSSDWPVVVLVGPQGLLGVPGFGQSFIQTELHVVVVVGH